MILTRDGQVYTCGSNTHGQLGHGDTTDRATPKLIELFEGPTQVVQIAAGASYTFAVTDDGTVHSFGSCTNFCLGHGDQHDELLPRAVQSFKRRNIHVVRVSAGDEHAVALDALGYVSLYCPVRIHIYIVNDCSPGISVKSEFTGLYLGQRILWSLRSW